MPVSPSLFDAKTLIAVWMRGGPLSPGQRAFVDDVLAAARLEALGRLYEASR